MMAEMGRTPRANRRKQRLDALVEHVAVDGADDRQFPRFILIGAQKGGTSSLYHYLTSHPDSAPAAIKELNYFTRPSSESLDWYRACFPRRSEAAFAGEASPSYLPSPFAPGRISADLPGVKLIALLRDPVERAHSAYWMQCRRGHESRSFADAIADEPPMLTGNGQLYPAWLRFAYRGGGLYADQLSRWLAAFDPSDLLILKSEEFFADPAAILGQTLAFLGMPDWAPDAFAVKQDGGDYPPLDREIALRLHEWYAPHNARLYDLLGRDFGWGPGA